MATHYKYHGCDHSDDLENMEYIYKYYIHHGVSIYLVACHDPAAASLTRFCPSTRTPAPLAPGNPIDCDCANNETIWSVRLQNVYTPGQPKGCCEAEQCPRCFGKDCTWACTSGLHTSPPYGSDYPNNRREANIGTRMTSLELCKLMKMLECGKIHTGQIILE